MTQKKIIPWAEIKAAYLAGMSWSDMMEKFKVSRGAIAKHAADGQWGNRKKEISQAIAEKAINAQIKKGTIELREMNLKVESGCDTAAGIAVTIIERIARISDGGEILSAALTERLSLAIQILHKALELKRLALNLGAPGAAAQPVSSEYESFLMKLGALEALHGNPDDPDDLKKFCVIKVEKPDLKN